MALYDVDQELILIWASGSAKTPRTLCVIVAGPSEVPTELHGILGISQIAPEAARLAYLSSQFQHKQTRKPKKNNCWFLTGCISFHPMLWKCLEPHVPHQNRNEFWACSILAAPLNVVDSAISTFHQFRYINIFIYIYDIYIYIYIHICIMIYIYT